MKRPLTEQERELVRWLLDHGEVDTSTFYQQIDSLCTVERCTCGCPTIYFTTSVKGERILSDHYGMVGDMQVGVILFEVDGLLSSLEVYSCGGTDQAFDLPPLHTLSSVNEPYPLDK